MSNATNPVEAVFEMQRRSIEFGERLVEQGVAAQHDAAETAIRNGFAAQREVQRQALELARRLFHAQVDAVQATVNGDEFRAIADQQFEAFGEDQAVAMEEFESAFVDAFLELNERQREVFVESIESTLDAHADVERQAVESANRTQDMARTAQRQTQDVAETAQRGTEQAVTQTADAVQQQMNSAGQRAGTAGRQTAAAGQQAAAASKAGAGGQQRGTAEGDAASGQPADTEQQADETAGAQLVEIDGLGSTYADRLRSEGIQSMQDLAQADPEAVAEIADAPEEQAEEWVETAASWS